MPKTWKECSDCNDIPCYGKLADDSGRVENILLRIERRGEDDRGQVDSLSRAAPCIRGTVKILGAGAWILDGELSTVLCRAVEILENALVL